MHSRPNTFISRQRDRTNRVNSNGNLVWLIVLVDGVLQESAGSSPPSRLAVSRQVHRIASAVNSLVKVLPLAGHFEVGFVHPLTLANRVLAPTKYDGQHRYPLDCPAMHGGVVNENTAFSHHLFNMAQTQRIGYIPVHACEHHFQQVVGPNEHLAQGAVD